MTCKCGDGSPSFPHSKPEAGDQENICLFKKKKPSAAWLAVLTKELGRVRCWVAEQGGEG